MIRHTGRCLLVILLVLYADRHLCEAGHHLYCQTSCAGLRLKADRISCLLRCDQDLTGGGVFYRSARGPFPYLSLVPATLPGDALSDDLDGLGDASPFEIPVNDVLVREPRDRSAFVRIGKRDVSAVLNPGQGKRRNEFVRIGKSGNQGNRKPFVVGRPFTAQGRASDTWAADGYEESKMAGPGAADETLLIPIEETNKRPSAFVRIGKRRNDDDSNENAGSLGGAYGKNVSPRLSHALLKENGGSSEEGPADPDQPGELEKKASAFVRIGRKGAAFVRIGKYDPNNRTSG